MKIPWNVDLVWVKTLTYNNLDMQNTQKIGAEKNTQPGIRTRRKTKAETDTA